MSSIFPSISIKRKTKGQSSTSAHLGQAGSSQSQIFRPLTPEATRKVISGGGDTVFESHKPFNGHLSATSSLHLKENEGDSAILDSPFSTSPLPEPKVPAKSPRPQSRSGIIHRESTSSFHDRSSSVNSETSLFGDLIEAPMVDQEDIIALTHHVRAFSEALSALRNTFFEASENPEDDSPEVHVKAHERLGEVLSILKSVLNQYQPLHSTDILAAAGTLINKVKSHNYDESDKAPEEFCESIDQLALAFSSSVSDFLMGDQDMPMSSSREHSRSLEDFADDDEDDEIEEDERTYEGDDYDDQDDEDYRDSPRRPSDKKETSIDKSAQKADELDKTLYGLEHGVDLTLQRTKVWSKYAKEIATYLERRAHLELEFTNKLSKLAQTTRAAITEDRYLPFQSIYVTSLDQDIEYAENCAKTQRALLSSKFLEPLQSRRSYHERKRKELKEHWTKSYKKLNEAIVKLEKAKQAYVQKQQELEKSKSLTDAKDGQEVSTAFTRTQKKKQDDLRKADEAEEWFKQCVSEANVRQRELVKTKSHVLVELRQLIYQCDQTMKAVTCNFFHMMNAQSTPAPIRFQCLEESSRAYEPGSQFSDFVNDQLTSSQPTVERAFLFENYQASNSGSADKLNSSSRALHSPTHDNGKTSPFTTRRHQSLQITGHHLNSSHPHVKAWGLQDHTSDAESTGSKSAPASPEGSPVAARHKNRQHQSLTIDSSDDESTNESNEKEAPKAPKFKSTSRSGTGPFQNCRMSVAAETHKFKKLRSPSKCRDCDSYVYFNGAECSNCGLTCHRKCLARIMISCDRKANDFSDRTSDYNVGRRMTTFGVDFYSHLRANHKNGECVPYIVSLCIEEINSRGLEILGIYRIPGVKSKVEKVCQVFENSTGVVDVSFIPPHVIAAVLKLYLRQLPEPLLTFNMYPEFIKIAKESLEISRDASLSDDLIREHEEDIARKLREVVVKLPKANFMTAAMIINHLKVVVQNADKNHMSACNLGIVFGPTLLRPRESAFSDSLSMSALVDMPHQTKAVELLIKNPQVFEPPGQDDPAYQESPVEEFSSLDRDKNGNETSLGNVCSSRGRDGKPLPVDVLLTTDDGSSDTHQDDHNDLNEQDKLVRPVKPVKPADPVEPVELLTEGSPNKLMSQNARSAVPQPKVNLGFESEFFDLLAKSNNRKESENTQLFSMPEFLRPESTDEQGDVDKDVDDSYDESTQGTSGSHTPDDELNSSRGSLGRDSLTPNTEDPTSEPPVNHQESRGSIPSLNSLPDIDVVSKSSSTYSAASTSFGSDVPDEKSLPDLSESPDSEQKNFDMEREDFSFTSPRSDDRPIPSRSVDDSSVPSRTRSRPSGSGLFKRNSDLPGKMSLFGFFPIGAKSPLSEPDVTKKSTKEANGGIARPVPSGKKHPGISDALREMHVVYDPLISHTEQKDIASNQATPDEEEKTEVINAPVDKTQDEVELLKEVETEPHSSKEWYISEQEDIREMDADQNTIQVIDSLDDREEPGDEEAAGISGPVEQDVEVAPDFESEESFTDIELKSPRENLPFSFTTKQKAFKTESNPETTLTTKEDSAKDNEETQGKLRKPARVSVKDRRRQYESPEKSSEQSSDKPESPRKPQSPVGNFDIASRKQIFESYEKGTTKKETFKKLNELSKKAKSTGLLENVDNGSISRGEYEDDEQTDSPSGARDETSELENSRLNKAITFESRKVDIPLDHNDRGVEEQKKLLLTSANSFPLRSSPKPTRRSPRRQFPEDTTQEDREPQFV